MNKIIVTHQYYYDLLFRAIYGYLEPNEYDIDYINYIKAGIAFNTKGMIDSSRKISFYSQVYQILLGLEAYNKVIIQESIKYFYEDIYDIYLDCIKSHIFKRVNFKDFIFIKPTWTLNNSILNSFKRDKIQISKYKSQSYDKLLLNLPNIDISDSQLRYIQAAYDCTKNYDKVLEVLL